MQEKSRVEVRNCIKRDFDAMIRKEREMRFKTIGKNKIIREQIHEENTEMMVNKNKEKKKKLTQTTIVDATPKVVETKQKINEMENCHQLKHFLLCSRSGADCQIAAPSLHLLWPGNSSQTSPQVRFTGIS